MALGPNYGFLSSLGEAVAGRIGSMGRRVFVDNPASSDRLLLFEYVPT